MTQPMLFDMDQLHREAVAATPWSGAPLAYTTDYWTPEELDAAWERYIAENGNHGCIPGSHMWHHAVTAPGGWGVPPLVFEEHEMVVYGQHVLPHGRARSLRRSAPCGPGPVPGDLHSVSLARDRQRRERGCGGVA